MDTIDETPDAAIPIVSTLDARPDAVPQTGECPEDMAPVASVCMDLYEAPNAAGAKPLVMYTFDQAEAWCKHRGKRLCYDDEWQDACEGASNFAYPYGAARVPGKCDDAKIWRVYSQTLLNGWPPAVAAPGVESLADLFAAARGHLPNGKPAADHVEWLYQGSGSGIHTGCVGAAGVFDLVGSVEEWTRRRDGGMQYFHGNLKGRYWAESRTCQSGVKSHGDAFRFYEIGFRCCLD